MYSLDGRNDLVKWQLLCLEYGSLMSNVGNVWEEEQSHI